MNWLSMDVPTGWAELLVRTLKVVVVAFVVLQLKEWVDAGMLDTLATLTDAALIAGGLFVVNAVLMWTAPKGAQDQQLARQ